MIGVDVDMIDVDLGFDEALDEAAALDGAEALAGIRSGAALKYAPFVEAEYAFIRDSTDRLYGASSPPAALGSVVRQNGRNAPDILASALASEIRGDIEAKGLVDTGAMRDSVEGWTE